MIYNEKWVTGKVTFLKNDRIEKHTLKQQCSFWLDCGGGRRYYVIAPFNMAIKKDEEVTLLLEEHPGTKTNYYLAKERKDE